MTTKKETLNDNDYNTRRSQDVGHIMGCSFEEILNVLMKATGHAEQERSIDVLKTILLGQLEKTS